MEERPVTACPECGGEIDLTYSSGPGDTITCTICGAELVVLGLEPADVAVAE